MACSRSFLPFILLFTVACPLTGKKTCELHLVNADGEKALLRVDIADTDELRERGLMFRKSLDGDGGMLFVFPHERLLNFWMKNTSLPLSIAYIGSNGVINEIFDMEPLDISVTYPSSQPARYALEVNRGWFITNKMTAGSRIILDGCLGK
ncbi:MAG: DUF192 domain-containing protein [Spirochaetes bacterium]|nr:DUF192 domain-containing protein [Spirochaetota bacterium]